MPHHSAHRLSRRTHSGFENNSPVDPRFRKPHVKGVTAKVINAAILAGDSYPSSPIGINLPNANWIRAAHGSKSVTIENLTQAYDDAAHGNGFNEEFVIDARHASCLTSIYSSPTTSTLTCTNVSATLPDSSCPVSTPMRSKSMARLWRRHAPTSSRSTTSQTPKMLEIGLLDNPDAYKAEYYKYILNGMLTQLQRIEPGKEVEEAHMRNRKLIAEWAYEHGKDNNVIELVNRDGKTFIKINDYEALRGLFGELLAEIQRIRSTGDYEAGRAMIEKYAVKNRPRAPQRSARPICDPRHRPIQRFCQPRVHTCSRQRRPNHRHKS